MSGSLAAPSTSQAHWRSCADRRGVPFVESRVSSRPQQWACRRAQQRAAAAASSHVAGDASITGAQAILDRYRAMLHEYRTHKDALGDWLGRTSALQRRHPQLLDAEATGDQAFVSRFQQYLMVRKRLLAEIPLLRDQLAEELQLQQQPHAQAASSSDYQQHRRRPGSSNGSSGGHHSHAYGVVNANQTAPVSKVQAVGQYFAAVNYRKQRSVRDSSSSSSGGSSADQLPAAAAAGAAGADAERQLFVASVLPAADADAGSNNAVSHLLQAATSGSSTSSSAGNSSSRAASAALAALNYKKTKQGGAAAGSDSGIVTSRQQRPLAMQLTESPPPPPGYKPGGSGSSNSAPGQQQQAVVVGSVETAKGDVYAGRLRRQLDKDVSLETTLQGVPGGLGSEQMFAVAHSAAAGEGAAGSISSVSGSLVVDAAAKAAADALLAAAAREAAASSAVGLVVTAKFDAYSGRQRKLQPGAQLDDFFASIEQAHSVELAAAAAAPVGSGSSSMEVPAAAATAAAATAEMHSGITSAVSTSVRSNGVGKQAKGQKHSGFGGSSSDDAVMILPADIIPLPT
ncbi:hypothetical protein COO60DRAFT_1074383 [Scenedesmus sp. NREL 46B-D3]|nr:hypothetical protein COO60DRAFT_1074383 [Scenedesmus sp. NREL 46B-D3]